MSFFKPNIDKLSAKGDVDGLIHALKNRDPVVRERAMQALRKLNDPRAVEPLIALADDNALGWEVPPAIASFGEAAVERASSILADPESALRPQAALVLGWVGDRRVLGSLVRALGDDDAAVRRHAVSGIGSLLGAEYAEEEARGAGVREALELVQGRTLLRTVANQDDDEGVQAKARLALTFLPGDSLFDPPGPVEAQGLRTELADFQALLRQQVALLAGLVPLREENARSIFARLGITEPQFHEDPRTAFSAVRQYAMSSEGVPLQVVLLRLSEESGGDDFLYVHLDDDVLPVDFLMCALASGGYLTYGKTGSDLRQALDLDST